MNAKRWWVAALLIAMPVFAGEVLTKDDAKDVEAVIKNVVAAGFLDTEKATVYRGKLAVSVTYDPSKDAPPLPTSASTMQMTDSGNLTTYSYAFEGLHFKLADGSWLIALQYHFKPRAADKINDQDLTVVKVSDLTATAAKEHPFDAEKDAPKWLDPLEAADRPRMAAAMNLLVPVSYYLKLTPNDMAPALVLLRRAGWTDAAAATVSLSDQRARNYWQLRPWTGPESIFDPSGAYPNAKAEEDAWKKAHPKVAPEAPAVALRRALFRWCRAQLMAQEPEDAFFSREIAAATSKAMIDPKDPQGYAAKIDLLLAGSKLPITPDEKADLPARLQSWEAHPRMPRMVVQGGGQKMSPSISTSFVAPKMAYEPDKTDLDALVALLGDDRPSRCWDFNGPRTVGENAWRAVAKLLKDDPRTLAKFPADKPWTAAERHAASEAVQKWWKDHRKEYIEK